MLVAVTRPKERAEETAEQIRKRGWEPLIVSPIEVVPIPINPSIKLEDFDWLVVTSATGADVLWMHFKEDLKDINIAVVGPKTKAAFEKRGVVPSIVASKHVGEYLASELMPEVGGKKVLVARASIARKGLVEMLSKIADVKEIAIYDTSFPAHGHQMKNFKELLEKNKIDAVVFTSSQSAKNLSEFIGKEGLKRLNSTLVCAIGPITSSTIKELGIKVTCMPKKHTVDSALTEISKLMHST